ncbi:hypothetical protein APX01_19235 [Cereibacter sphaeroides]|jgi:hypothetical protein|nr:hypothetical protein APX01_19235 [Cereibacter sphaeroides]ANS36394.1 hypothetical protein A3858_19240 [Cereibacter sphaeroides]ATN65451.1 hypothetical protein A3857_19265 [Cereibacter sphaeroides]QJC85716.1 hypothetical protein HGN32_15960 [Cereibacter sphaeroides]GEM95258.1 hypothetical protein RSP03_43250 [Cereibacter sphaeroides]
MKAAGMMNAMQGDGRSDVQRRIEAMTVASGGGRKASAAAVAFSAEDERQRLAAMLAAATPPEAMQAAPVAPARGAQRLVPNVTVLPGGLRRIEPGHWEAADVFDAMTRSAWLKHEAAVEKARLAHEESKSEENFTAPVFEPPFSPGQIAMARHYRGLVERHSAGGVRCSSAEALLAGGVSGGGDRDWMDGYLREGEELARLRARIGTGSAMVVRRIRPSARGSKASIADRTLVDMVALSGKTLSEVLAAHGWAKCTEHLGALRLALATALDRMQGYRT